jgi:hypothetical protein
MLDLPIFKGPLCHVYIDGLNGDTSIFFTLITPYLISHLRQMLLVNQCPLSRLPRLGKLLCYFRSKITTRMLGVSFEGIA